MCTKNLKKEWGKYQNRKLNYPLRILDFIWRKKYKYLLWIIWGVGLLSILFGEIILRSVNINVENITAADKILGFVYFSTAVIIFWYTRETYDLKIIQQKDLKESRRKSDFDIMPYFRLQLSSEFRTNSFISLINDGRGLAKEIKLRVYYKGNEFNVKTIPVVAAGPNNPSGIDLHHIINATEALFEEWKNERTGGKWDFRVEGEYLDLIDRPYLVKFKFNKNVKDFFEIVEQHPDSWNIGG